MSPGSVIADGRVWCERCSAYTFHECSDGSAVQYCRACGNGQPATPPGAPAVDLSTELGEKP